MESSPYSFSIPPHETAVHKAVKKLKKHCKDTGLNFSHQVGIAILNHVTKMGLLND